MLLKLHFPCPDSVALLLKLLFVLVSHPKTNASLAFKIALISLYFSLSLIAYQTWFAHALPWCWCCLRDRDAFEFVLRNPT